MLRKREIVLKESENNKVHIKNGSLFHGFLMEKMPEDYAAVLHESNVRPFSQYLNFSKEEKKWIWTIGSLNKTADDALEKVLSNISTIELKNKGLVLDIDYVRTYPAISYKELTEKCYTGKVYNTVDIEFLTPCSFKVAGRNVIMPEIKLIYQNIINRWNEFSETISIKDKDAMDHIIQHTTIRDYNIRSRNFALESVTVKGCEGSISLKISGPDTLISLCNLLFRFAEYSGIGTRTALGMGGVRIGFK